MSHKHTEVCYVSQYGATVSYPVCGWNEEFTDKQGGVYALSKVLTENEKLQSENAALREERERLRDRIHEVAAAKDKEQAEFKSQIAKHKSLMTDAKKWTEDKGLLASWAIDPTSPFWPMTSENNRAALAELIDENKNLREENERLRSPSTEFSKEICDKCPDCGPIAMCVFHSLLSTIEELREGLQRLQYRHLESGEECRACGGYKAWGCKPDCWLAKLLNP